MGRGCIGHPRRRVADRTRGYPYFLQEFGKHAWDVAGGPDDITAADVETATPLALAELDTGFFRVRIDRATGEELDTGFFRVRIDRATGEERTYLVAMASLGTGPYATGDVAAVLNRTATVVGPHHDALIRRGLCYSPRHDVIDFTVPMFDEFVRRALT